MEERRSVRRRRTHDNTEHLSSQRLIASTPGCTHGLGPAHHEGAAKSVR
jgi:hypothetical protein